MYMVFGEGATIPIAFSICSPFRLPLPGHASISMIFILNPFFSVHFYDWIQFYLVSIFQHRVTPTTTEKHGIKSFSCIQIHCYINAHNPIQSNLMLNMNFRFEDVKMPLVIFSLVWRQQRQQRHGRQWHHLLFFFSMVSSCAYTKWKSISSSSPAGKQTRNNRNNLLSL